MKAIAGIIVLVGLGICVYPLVWQLDHPDATGMRVIIETAPWSIIGPLAIFFGGIVLESAE